MRFFIPCGTLIFALVAAIHQLHYLPWLRYFDKIARADIFICLDNIQFNKGGWQNRNKIKTQKGALLLSVPVHSKYRQNLNEITINNGERWMRKHRQAFLTYYAKAPYFKKYFSFFEETYERTWEKLNDLNFHMLDFFLKELGIATKILKGTDMSVEGEATERLVNLCKGVGADTYLCGDHAAEVYLDEQLFKNAGIRVQLQNWTCPVYDQQCREAGFIPDLSIVDLLFNKGDESFSILRNSKVERA